MSVCVWRWEGAFQRCCRECGQETVCWPGCTGSWRETLSLPEHSGADRWASALAKDTQDELLFWGHIWLFSGLTPISVLRDHAWLCSGDRLEFWGANPGCPGARQAPNLLCYLFGPQSRVLRGQREAQSKARVQCLGTERSGGPCSESGHTHRPCVSHRAFSCVRVTLGGGACVHVLVVLLLWAPRLVVLGWEWGHCARITPRASHMGDSRFPLALAPPSSTHSHQPSSVPLRLGRGWGGPPASPAQGWTQRPSKQLGLLEGGRWAGFCFVVGRMKRLREGGREGRATKEGIQRGALGGPLGQPP